MASRSIWIGGFHGINALLQTHPERILALYLQQDRSDKRAAQLLNEAEAMGVAVQRMPAKWFQEQAERSGGLVHQGVLANVRPVEPLDEAGLDRLLNAQPERHVPLLLVLDGVTDPHNLGASLRTAEAAGVDAVIVPRDRACGLTPAARKASAGASERLPLVEVTNLARTLDALKARGIWLVGTAGDAETSVYQTRFATDPVALVMGSEGRGMRRLTRDRVDELVRIPMVDTVESLNVSVACGVCLFEFRRQRLAVSF
ncbi:MAG TPA: 23S rRNA (guanosine(2251)-2'-O)-methyltransferase RlmB [Halothiobacillaceae bacterium]|nr:23S rRNA (guanosine(2251)-2'-O)-methyltransferase RlmB [Halothiobacillaceae bacterium]